MSIVLLKHTRSEQSLLGPASTAGAQQRHRLESFEQARVTATRRPPVPDRGDMRRRPATPVPAAAETSGARRQVTIATVRAAERQASPEELLAAALTRLAELLGPRRCLTADGEVYR